MKKLLMVVYMIFYTSQVIEAKTNWEIYTDSPTEENADKVDKIEYSKRWDASRSSDADIELLSRKIKLLHQPSLKLAFRVLSGYRTGWDGSGNPRVRKAISMIVKKNPKLYLEALNNTNVKECIGIEPIGDKYVDHPCLLAKDGVALFEVFNKLESSSPIYQTCLNDLKGYIEVNNECNQHISYKEKNEIQKSNKSYQVYQKMNQYDILDKLIKNSNYLNLLEYYTSDLEYWGAIDYHRTDKGTLFMLVRVARKMLKNGKEIFSTMPLNGIDFNPLNARFTDGSNNALDLKYPKVWLKIFNIYHLNKLKEYLYIKEKSFLYKKPDLKHKSKKFLIKNDCALIIDKTKDGWYEVFYYHPYWHTNTIRWIKFDAKKHGLII